MRKWRIAMSMLTSLGLAACGEETRSAPAAAAPAPKPAEGVRIEKKREVLKQGEREAVIHTPVFQGIADPAVLRTLQESIASGIRDATGSSPEEWKAEYQGGNWWLTEIDYEVTYNAHDLLSLAYVVGGVGAYPDQTEAYVVVDLKTGRRLGAKDLFTSREELAANVDRMRAAAVEEAIHEHEMAEEDLAAMEPARQSRFGVENLDTFRLDERGVTFLYDFGFPHAIEALEPSGEYFLSWEGLRPFVRPDGPLARIVG